MGGGGDGVAEQWDELGQAGEAGEAGEKMSVSC